MVRIQRRTATKSYLNDKRIYKYQRLDLSIPKKYQEAISSFLKLDLEMTLVVKGRKIFIELEDRDCKESNRPGTKAADVSRYF
jgi:hypothetical protein